jgi:hypothetical protein
VTCGNTYENQSHFIRPELRASTQPIEQSRLLHHVTTSRARQSTTTTCRQLRPSLRSVTISGPPVAPWSRLRLVNCSGRDLRHVVSGDAVGLCPMVREELLKSLQNRNAYLLVEGPVNTLHRCGSNSRGQLLLPLCVTPSARPQQHATASKELGLLGGLHLLRRRDDRI